MRLIFLSFLLIIGVSAFAQNPYQLISVGPTLPSQPLIIVNENVAHNQTLKLIAPEEIESLEVLKDAASAPQYCNKKINIYPNCNEIAMKIVI